MEWSEAKHEVFAFENNIVVSAGAGSGKTAALVELYLRLLAGETGFPRQLSVEEIVAITFTDKAAVEMRERVRRGMTARHLAGDLSAPWDSLLRTLSAAPIATFHSFCARLLRENTAEACVDPHFTTLDEMVAARELRAAFDEVIEEKLQARCANLRLLLQQYPLSAAGRGRGLREHLFDLRKKRAVNGIGSRELLLKADQWDHEAGRLFQAKARELEELSGEVERVLAGKELGFHKKLRDLPALCRSARLSPEAGATPDILAAMSRCIAGNWGKERPLKERLEECVEVMHAACWQLRSAPLASALLALSENVEEAYRRRKDRRGGLDFDDLQGKALHLLKHDTILREECRCRFPVVMVDEFQDTNLLQKELLEHLCGEKQRLFIVGDPKQSIYLFRGADVAIFGRAQAEMRATGGRNIYFRESFRSREGIIRFVNHFFSGVMAEGAAPFELCYGEHDHLDPKRIDPDGAPCVELLTIGAGSTTGDRNSEAAAIALKILQIVAGQEGVRVYDKEAASSGEAGVSSRTPRFADIALLFRRFTHLKVFERELRRHGIPYYVVKGKGFYRCQEVLDLLNFLNYLEFAGDLTALTGVLRSPLCGISDETLYLLSRLEGGMGSWESSFFPSRESGFPPSALDRMDPADIGKLHRLACLISHLRPLRDRLTLPELLEEILAGTDFTSSLLTTFQGNQKAANLRKLVEFSRSFGNDAETGLRGFTNHMAELVETEPTEAEAVIAAEGEDVVRLMTIHQSKGLEFPVVFIPELGAGSQADHAPVQFDEASGVGMKVASAGGTWHPTLAYQAVTALKRRKEAAELKRLLYVATTRARDYLVLSGERGKNGKGPWREWVDCFVAGEWGNLVKVTEIASAKGLPFIPPDVEAATSGIPSAAMAKGLQRSLHYSSPLPTMMTFSPTALEDYGYCPRKYFYKGVMGLDEGLFSEVFGNRQGRAPSSSVMTPLEKGDLAHLLLERLDFSASVPSQRAACLRIARAAVFDPDRKGMEEVIENILALAASPLGRHLARKRLLREYPFTLRLTGDAAYYIKGAIDLVAVEDNGATVYDYKYLEKKDAELEGYRFQLRTYMLAVAHALPEGDVSGKLLFLKGGCEEAVHCDLPQFRKELIGSMNAIRVRSTEKDFGLREGCSGDCPFRQRCVT